MKSKIIFNVVCRNIVKPFVDRFGGKIEIRDYISREELLKVLSRMDFLMNIENSADNMITSKLIDY